jgi:hypothetical protein
MANEIIITVKNQIETTEQQQVPKPITQDATTSTVTGKELGGALTAQFLVGASRRLIAATGNNEISGAISKVAKYGFLTARALLPPNPVGLATLAITISADALDKVTDNIRKQASLENEIDNARIKAGLLDISQTQIRTNWFSGRQTYRRF